MMVSRMRDASDEASCLGCCLELESMRAAPDGLYVVVGNRASRVTRWQQFLETPTVLSGAVETTYRSCLPSIHTTFTCVSELNI
jgi:hypothetical protein